MRIPIHQVDAFTDHVFGGNPAAVCPLERWLPDETLQAIASENNLSETAFLVRSGEGYELRWFTPAVEVDLCGHATLAAAHVVFRHLRPSRHEVSFATREAGTLRVLRRADDRLELTLPRRPGVACAPPAALVAALGRAPRETLLARDLVAVLGSEDEVRALVPDLGAVRELDALGLVVTAPGRDVDFVSRYFGPRVGIPEDPVTGSAHCTLVPYWSAQLGKTQLEARQVSSRGGWLSCEDRVAEGTVALVGRAAQYLEGVITL
jgi:predicted PhzF superfamily epimerase YddE/YHI9